MIYTDSSDQCTGFFLCQEALGLKEKAFSLKSFDTPWNVSILINLLGKNPWLVVFIFWLMTDNSKLKGILQTNYERKPNGKDEFKLTLLTKLSEKIF